MPNREKSHNEQVDRVMSEKVKSWEPLEGSPGWEICQRKGKLVVRRVVDPTTIVEPHIRKGVDR